MNINKALEHFEWKFKNVWKPSAKDVEAYNTILDFKETQDQKAVNDHELFAKLWIEKLIVLIRTRMYNGERSIQVIDEILQKSVYEMCLILKEEIPMMRFRNIGLDKYPEEDILNLTKTRERNRKIVEEFETELTEALRYEISEDDIIKFVSDQINRIVSNQTI